MENQKEIWKDIEDYEGYYQISNLGRVKSLQREVNNRWGGISVRKERILTITNNGKIGKRRYVTVILWKEHKFKTFLLHRLLGIHFIPNPENYPVLNHKDHNSFNNSLDNLEWTTQSQNVQHAFDAGRCEKLRKVNRQRLKLWHKIKDVKLPNYRTYAAI